MSELVIRDFNEELYLEANPDIKDMIKKGLYKNVKEYLEKQGIKEIKEGIRKFHPEFEVFNEELYLEKFSDVKEAVEKKLFKNGFDHFCKDGYKEIITKYRLYEKDKYIGFIENYNNGYITGWIVDQKYFDVNVKFDLYVNDKCIVNNITPNIFREDLFKKFNRNGLFGFRVHVGYIEEGNIYIKVNNKFVNSNNFKIYFDLMSFKDKEENLLDFYPHLKILFDNKDFLKLKNEIKNIIGNEYDNPLILVFIKVAFLYKLDISFFPFLNKIKNDKIKFLISHLIFSIIKYLWKEKGSIYVQEIEIKHIILFIKLIVNEKVEDLIIEDEFKIKDEKEFYNLIERLFRSKYYFKPYHVDKVLNLLLNENLKYKLDELKIEYTNLYEMIKSIWLDIIKINNLNVEEYLSKMDFFGKLDLDVILIAHILDLIKILIQFKKEIDIDYIFRTFQDKIEKINSFEIIRKIHFLKPTLYYFLGNIESAYFNLESLLSSYDIYTLEWNINFLSDILYSYGKLYGFDKINFKFYELIKNRIKEDRSSYKDNILMLYFYKKENLNTDFYFKILRNLMWRIFEFDGSKEELEKVFNLVEDNYLLLYPYFDFYLNLKNNLLIQKKSSYKELNTLDDNTELLKVYLYNEKLCKCKIKDDFLGLINDISYIESKNNKKEKNKSFIIFQKIRNQKEFNIYKDFYSSLKRKFNFLKSIKINFVIGNNIFNEHYQEIKKEELKYSLNDLENILYLNYNTIFNHNIISYFNNINIDECILKNDYKKLGVFKTSYRESDLELFLKDINKFNLDIKLQCSILSFSNLNEKEIKYLMNLNFPVIFLKESLYDSLKYLINLYKIADHMNSINTKTVSLISLKKSKQNDNDDIACFIVERNEKEKLESILDYYRDLGVDKFYIIDNCSDDDTLEYLSKFNDVELFSTSQAYSQSLYGVKWCDVLIKSKRINKWNLIIDADELLVLDNFKNLKDLRNYLINNDYDSLYVPFIDMYSKGSIKNTPLKKGIENLKECGYYDKVFFTYYTLQGGITGNLPTFQGGVRFRHFNLNTVVLNKIPFFKFIPKMRLREGLHWIDNCKPFFGGGVLLHFKYTHFFYDYVEREIKRGQHWNNASEYKQYYEVIKNNIEFSLYDKDFSAYFNNVSTFFEKIIEGF